MVFTNWVQHQSLADYTGPLTQLLLRWRPSPYTTDGRRGDRARLSFDRSRANHQIPRASHGPPEGLPQQLKAARWRRGLRIEEAAPMLGVVASTLWWWDKAESPTAASTAGASPNLLEARV